MNSLRTPGPSYKASASALQSTSDLHTNHLYNARNLGFNLVILFLDVFITHFGDSLIHTEWFTLLALSIFNIEKENELKPAIAIIPQNQGVICCFADCHFTCLVHSLWLVSTEISENSPFLPSGAFPPGQSRWDLHRIIWL